MEVEHGEFDKSSVEIKSEYVVEAVSEVEHAVQSVEVNVLGSVGQTSKHHVFEDERQSFNVSKLGVKGANHSTLDSEEKVRVVSRHKDARINESLNDDQVVVLESIEIGNKLVGSELEEDNSSRIGDGSKSVGIKCTGTDAFEANVNVFIEQLESKFHCTKDRAKTGIYMLKSMNLSETNYRFLNDGIYMSKHDVFLEISDR
jgi:hypothetical protein